MKKEKDKEEGGGARREAEAEGKGERTGARKEKYGRGDWIASHSHFVDKCRIFVSGRKFVLMLSVLAKDARYYGVGFSANFLSLFFLLIDSSVFKAL